MEILAFFGVMFVLAALCFAFFSDSKKVEVKETEKPVEKEPIKFKTNEERQAEVQEELNKLLAQETDKYFFTVKLKNGKTMRSEVFKANGYVDSHGGNIFTQDGTISLYRAFYHVIITAKEQAERAMTQSVNGFLKINDVFVNENEIVMKKIVKVREND